MAEQGLAKTVICLESTFQRFDKWNGFYRKDICEKGNMIYLNGTPLNVTIFPDNTSQVWHLPEETFISNKAYVEWKFDHEGELFHLLQLQHLLDKKNIETTLYLRYLPYGRQDKLVSNDSTFALSTFWKTLHMFNFYKMIIMDPHNFDAVRPNCQLKTIYPREQLLKAMVSVDSDLICYPDKGAVNKYTKIGEIPYVNFPYMYGEKVRDQASGKITSYSTSGNPKDKKAMIVDDICDGGMTFVLLAKELLAKGAKQVDLFVTHGIFSKGLKPLKEAGINRIFTQDGEVSEIQGNIVYEKLS